MLVLVLTKTRPSVVASRPKWSADNNYFSDGIVLLITYITDFVRVFRAKSNVNNTAAQTDWQRETSCKQLALVVCSLRACSLNSLIKRCLKVIDTKSEALKNGAEVLQQLNSAEIWDRLVRHATKQVNNLYNHYSLFNNHYLIWLTAQHWRVNILTFPFQLTLLMLEGQSG